MNIKEFVNVDSYSSSPGFVGYCQFPGDVKKAGIICAEFIQKILEESSDAEFCASITFGGQLEELEEWYEISKSDIELLFKPILQSDLLGCPTLDLNPITEENKHLIAAACQVITSIGGIRGDFFIYLPSKDIVIYPHDDIGFGFIYCKSDKFASKMLLDSEDFGFIVTPAPEFKTE